MRVEKLNLKKCPLCKGEVMAKCQIFKNGLVIYIQCNNCGLKLEKEIQFDLNNHKTDIYAINQTINELLCQWNERE